MRVREEQREEENMCVNVRKKKSASVPERQNESVNKEKKKQTK